jgi:hypothetical protein
MNRRKIPLLFRATGILFLLSALIVVISNSARRDRIHLQRQAHNRGDASAPSRGKTPAVPDVTGPEKSAVPTSLTKFASFVNSGPARTLPPSYKPYGDIETRIRRLAGKYPDLLQIEEIGRTTSRGLPIWAVKVSDNVRRREDEPRILFTGVHHAREPIGANICLELMNRLCASYQRDDEIRKWVDGAEIWFVPVVNPDGYEYIMENNLHFPWWRKNLRDNDGDGIFNPLLDGVDLNRNYDFNWDEGGDGKFSSWFYRGTEPFSEEETKAVMRLAERENFVIGISYHSYGESVLFPWGNFDRPPDLDLIIDVAEGLASRMGRVSGHGQYSVIPLNGRVGQSSIWMYGMFRTIDFIVEVGTDYYPAEHHIPFILREHTRGAFYLLDRMLDTGLKGHVFDFYTRTPLVADIDVLELAGDYVRPRRTDPESGNYHRLLNPGYYTVEIRSEGYNPRLLTNVKVEQGNFAVLEIGLFKTVAGGGDASY